MMQVKTPRLPVDEQSPFGDLLRGRSIRARETLSELGVTGRGFSGGGLRTGSGGQRQRERGEEQSR